MRFKNGLLLCTFLLTGILTFSLGWTNKKPVLKKGIYRSVLTRPDGMDIIFNFEVKDSAGRTIIYVLNATEKLLVDSVRIAGDSVFIQMPFFDSGFRAEIDNHGNLRGQWVKKLAESEQVFSFKATYNQKQRFTAHAKPKYDVTGRWDATFTGKNNEQTKAIGEFKQVGTKLTGTFLTPAGDYRYLEGIVSGDSLFLSAFDGGHAFLFTARIENGNNITQGNFYTGAAGKETWLARKDETVELQDGYSQTSLHEGETKLNFSFRGIDGGVVSINDERFRNKAVVVQIMGSWCPNCMDETAFLSDYYNRNSQRGIEVIGLAYERTTDYERSKKSLQRFKDRFDVRYPVLVTGVAVSDPKRTEKTIPQLIEIKAFPTTIFIDKKGIVKKIYTGFNGPGTGDHYSAFRKEFDETIRSLLKD